MLEELVAIFGPGVEVVGVWVFTVAGFLAVFILYLAFRADRRFDADERAALQRHREAAALTVDPVTREFRRGGRPL